MHRLFIFVISPKQRSCGVLTVALCGNWLYLPTTSASAKVQYFQSSFAFLSSALTEVMSIKFNRSNMPFSSWLNEMFSACVMSMSPSVSVASLLVYLPAFSVTGYYGVLPHFLLKLVRNLSITATCFLFLNVITYAYRVATSMTYMKYSSMSASGIFGFVPVIESGLISPSMSLKNASQGLLALCALVRCAFCFSFQAWWTCHSSLRDDLFYVFVAFMRLSR